MKTVTEDGEVIDTVTEEPIAMAPGPFWKTPFNHDTSAEANRGALVCNDASKTQQQFAKDADINVILAKFMNGGDLPLTGQPVYQDADAYFDLQNAIVTKHEVDQAWDALPAKVRNVLKDPKTFADYVVHACQTGDLEDLRELGLAKAKAPEPAITPGGSPVPPSPEKPA